MFRIVLAIPTFGYFGDTRRAKVVNRYSMVRSGLNQSARWLGWLESARSYMNAVSDQRIGLISQSVNCAGSSPNQAQIPGRYGGRPASDASDGSAPRLFWLARARAGAPDSPRAPAVMLSGGEGPWFGRLAAAQCHRLLRGSSPAGGKPTHFQVTTPEPVHPASVT